VAWDTSICRSHDVTEFSAPTAPGRGSWSAPRRRSSVSRRVLVMTSGLRGSDPVPKIVGSLKHHGLEVVVYDKAESNPRTTT
jgi:formaldehyde dismutase / methanol dehydrogenase